MAYILKLRTPITNNINEYSWFENAYACIETGSDHNSIEFLDKRFEQKFKVKFIYGEPEADDIDIPAIIGIEFPSETDATMFLLKWS